MEVSQNTQSDVVSEINILITAAAAEWQAEMARLLQQQHEAMQLMDKQH